MGTHIPGVDPADCVATGRYRLLGFPCTNRERRFFDRQNSCRGLAPDQGLPKETVERVADLTLWE